MNLKTPARAFAALLALIPLSCGHGAEKAAACNAAWMSRLQKIDSVSKRLDDEQAGSAQREASVKAAAEDAGKKLGSLTILSQERETWPDRMKGIVSKQRMRLVNMSPMKIEQGKPLPSVRYDIEIQGDYRYVARTVVSLYEQPKAFLLDRVEVNITDNYGKRATVKAQGIVYESGDPIAVPTPPRGLGDDFNAATAESAPPPACAGVAAPPAAAEAASKRAALLARAGLLDQLAGVALRDAQNYQRQMIYADVVRRRDDNRAAFASHVDELVRRAQGAVTLLAELRFKANGDPDWR